MKSRFVVLAILALFVPLGSHSAELSSCDEASLRAAMVAGGEILFTCDGTIVLAHTIQVNAHTVLRANGHAVTISGGGTARLFLVSPGVNFTIDGLVLADAVLRGFPGGTGQAGAVVDGGAILTFGVLTCNNCVFERNQAIGGAGGPAFGSGSLPGMGGWGRGGAICTGGGPVFLIDCIFRNNQASGARGGIPGDRATGGNGWGGALYGAGGSFTLMRCAFSNNVATFPANEIQPGQISGSGEGGAAFMDSGSLTATDCTFIANIGAGGNGGELNGRGGAGRAGGLRTSFAPVSLTNCRFEQNRAVGGHGGNGSVLSTLGFGGTAEGGALYCDGGNVTLTGCLVQNNEAMPGFNRRNGVPSDTPSAFGGGLLNASTVLRLKGCRLAANSAVSPLGGSAWGGAIYHGAGNLSLEECELAKNSAVGGAAGYLGAIGHGYGGAIYVSTKSLAATNSTFAFNVAVGGLQNYLNSSGGNALGGAVVNRGSAIIENCTLAGNEARGGDAAPNFFGGGGNGLGGAVYSEGSLSLTHATIASNIVQFGSNTNPNGVAQGGGIYSTLGTAQLKGVILAANRGSNCFGSTFVDQGNNLSSDISCPFTDASSRMNVDPRLGPLGDYGGSTPTMPLLSGSPAIDAIVGGSCLANDQRGRARPYGAGCDVGAFESSAPFTIRGSITGYHVAAGMEVSNGAATTSTAADFTYRFDGLAAGAYVIAPSHLGHLTVPVTRTVSVGPDAVGIDFTAHVWNSLQIQRKDAATVHLIYAGTNGNTVRLQSSTQLPIWNDDATYTVEPDGLIQVDYPTQGPRRFFRAIVP